MGTKRFPLFVDLTGKKALVIGGGTVGLRRAEVLARFGAEVTVVSESSGNLIVNVKDSRVAIGKDMANKIMVG